MFIFLLACVFLGCSRFDSSVFKYVVDYEQRDSHKTGKKQDKKKKFRTGCLRFLSVVQDLFHTFYDKGKRSALPVSTENMFEKKDSTKRTLSTYIEDDIGFVRVEARNFLQEFAYRSYLFVFKIYCSNFILEFQIICLFYLTDEN